jgi:hypothetical protein
MIANVPIYFVILPATTYVILERLSQVRRIFTDAKFWPVTYPAWARPGRDGAGEGTLAKSSSIPIRLRA